MTNNKVLAVVSYLTPIGWFISLILNMKPGDELVSFHIRQYLLIFLSGVVLTLVTKVIPLGFVWLILTLALIVLWVIGIVGAIKGEQKPLPVVGKYAQDWFKAL